MTDTKMVKSDTRVSVGGRIIDSTPKTDAAKRSISLDPSLVAALKEHRRA